MPRHATHVSVSREQRRDQKQKRPRRQQRGLDELPLEDRARAHRLRQQKGGLPVAKEIGIADHQVAQQQQDEQKGEQQEHQPLGQRGAESREARNETTQPEPRSHENTHRKTRRPHSADDVAGSARHDELRQCVQNPVGGIFETRRARHAIPVDAARGRERRATRGTRTAKLGAAEVAARA